MGMTFLAPMALAAAALAVLPWILHHIRRPEREPVRFSSLMFVPEIKREVIERRRLQHLLLMLLRMFIFLLLAYAFARPYVPLRAEALGPQGAERHVVLLDTSYSMGAGGAFDAAKEAARRIVDGLDATDRVAVVPFARFPRGPASLGEAGDARADIDAAVLTHDSTDYEAALRRAVDLLAGEASDPENSRLHLHLISDFQRRGLPERATGWRVPSYVAFNPVDVGAPGGNRSVTDIALREIEPGRLQVRAKVRNWSREAGETVTARLVADGRITDTKTVNVAPGNASQVVFDLEAAGDAPITGRVEVEDEVLAADNRRYFAWNPPRKQRVLVVDDAPESERWPASRLLAYALPDAPDTPWDLETVARLGPDDLEGRDLLILADASADPAIVLPYIARGGRALLCLGEADEPELLRALGLESAGLRYADTSADQFELLSWIDFEHPVFRPFADARFNDFSDVRFHNHRLLTPLPVPEGAAAPRPLARFEAAVEELGPPAIIEAARGSGRVLIWAFPLDLQWTTLPKTPRFLPLLHESLRFLIGEDERNRAWEVGDRATPPRQRLAAWQAGERLEPAALATPGYLEWREENEEPIRVEAVNVPADEGDPSRVTPEEFALRLCSAPVADPAALKRGAPTLAAGSALEYGRYVVGLVLAALVFESWYASRLARRAA